MVMNAGHVQIGRMSTIVQPRPQPDIDPALGAPMQFGGVHSGPCLQVSGSPLVLAALACDLAAIPYFGNMRGQVILTDAKPPEVIDALLDFKGTPLSRKDRYWQVLARMKALGMISGRGIPHSAGHAIAAE